MQLGLDINDAIEQLADDLVAVGFECFVELFEFLFGLLVYGGLGGGGGALMLRCGSEKGRDDVKRQDSMSKAWKGWTLTSFWKSLNSFSFLDLSCSISFDASLRASLSF